jgi:hypothetical protein
MGSKQFDAEMDALIQDDAKVAACLQEVRRTLGQKGHDIGTVMDQMEVIGEIEMAFRRRSFKSRGA